ncbi:UNVERIFIED_CONTAM: Peroxidase 1 [Sesamum angustifolium]|uniref:peroxidase n=1 Tax=Sesamum angustifolium TaxID=2727405 RepID=A0AAW2IQL7_9LAMI
MAVPKLLSVTFLFFSLQQKANARGLSVGFYNETCPSVEAIVHETTAKFVSRAPSLAPALLRMHFHDCFVRGCDGSVLLNSTANNTAKRDAFPNQSLRGFQVIDAVKSAVEKCPGRVSCADILALVARDAVSLVKGPRWKVPLGRRDGNVSMASRGLGQPACSFLQCHSTDSVVRYQGFKC